MPADGEKRKPPTPAVNLIAGGGAGMMEALACHPLGKLLLLFLVWRISSRAVPR